MMIVKSIWLILAIQVVAFATVEVRELLADPVTVTDKEGEFIELHENSFSHGYSGLITLVLDHADTLYSGGISFLPRGYVLLCADISTYEACEQTPLKKAFPNTRPFSVTLYTEFGEPQTINFPIALPGVSFDILGNNILPIQETAKESLSTPGFGNPLSDPEVVDWYLEAAVIDKIIRIKTLGSAPQGGVVLVAKDQNFDGEFDAKPDTVVGNRYAFSERLDRTLYLFEIIGDEYPVNNRCYVTETQPFKRLYVSELFPAPSGDEPEWFEMHNGGTVAVDLTEIVVHNGERSFTFAEPHVISSGEFCVVTQSHAAFIQNYGVLRSCILELNQWGALSNSGGTIQLKNSIGYAIDSIGWTSDDVVTDVALKRNIGEGAWEVDPLFKKGTPGVQLTNIPIVNSVERGVATMRLSNYRPELLFTISIAPGANFSYEIYDLSGFRIKAQQIELQGGSKVFWDGGVTEGRLVVPGLYIICYRFNDDSWIKAPLVVAP